MSLIVLTLSEMYVSEFCSRSATCEPTSVPIAPTNVRNSAITPKRISAVARPRRQPRRASRLTPGSMARARNSAMAKSTKRPLSLLQKNRTAIAPRNPLQNTMTAGMTQPGRRLSADEGTRSSSVSTANRGPSGSAGGRTLDGASLSIDTARLCPKRTGSKRQLTRRGLASRRWP